MSRYVYLVVLVLFSVLLFGCGNLKDKSVLMRGSVEGMKITTDIDPSSSSPMPLPKVDIGWFDFLWFDFPLKKRSRFVYYNQARSFWSDRVKETIYFTIECEDDGKDTGQRIKVRFGPEKIVNSAILTVTDPTSDNKLTVETYSDSPRK